MEFTIIFDGFPKISKSGLQDFKLVADTRIPRAAGPRDEGVHIRQNTSARVTTIM